MDIIINNSSLTPLYKQISNQIEKQILNGKLEVRESIPSIRGLAKELEVSVITIKKAYEELESKGLIEAKAGKGFFVGGANSEIVLETILKKIDEGLLEICRIGKGSGISKEELINKLSSMYDREV